MKKGNFNQRAQCFSIRKYNIGVASVLIASVLFMGGQVVASDNQVVTNENTKQETSKG